MCVAPVSFLAPNSRARLLASLQQPRVKCEWPLRDHPNARRRWMRWIDQVVEFLRDHCRRNRKHKRLAARKPGVTHLAAGDRIGNSGPSRRQIINSDNLDPCRIRYIELKYGEIFRNQIGVGVNQYLNKCQRKMACRIHDRIPGRVPTPTDAPWALAIQGIVDLPRDAPDAHSGKDSVCQPSKNLFYQPRTIIGVQ